jgi:hypothetical protein
MPAVRHHLRKIVFFHTTSDEDDFYMKIISLDEIYNFLVLNVFIWDYEDAKN